MAVFLVMVWEPLLLFLNELINCVIDDFLLNEVLSFDLLLIQLTDFVVIVLLFHECLKAFIELVLPRENVCEVLPCLSLW